MTRVCRKLVDLAARALEQDERDAVLGDFAEHGMTGPRALREVIGLVARRQAELWKRPQPWVALLGVALPVGMLLSRVAPIGTVLIHAGVFWSHGVRYRTGMTIAEEITVFACHTIAVLFWSWCAGWALGSMSRRTAWVNGFLFCVVASLFAQPYVVMYLPKLPLLALLVLLPCVLGVRQGRRLGGLGRRDALLCGLALAAVLLSTTWTGGWPRAAVVRWSEGAYQARAPGRRA